MALTGCHEKLNPVVRECLNSIDETVQLSSLDRDIITLLVQKVAIGSHFEGVKDGLNDMEAKLRGAF